jgi:predicted GIY-YIG superfamily endonuclease
MIMRKLRGSDLFFGGVLLICTLDHLQLRPIKGIPFLLSPHIMTCFRMLQLKHLVRSAHDPNLQRVIDICRMTRQEYEDNPTVIDELKELLRTHCTWVDNWDSPEIPRSATRCFGMRTPAHEAEARYINQVERECASSGSPFLRVNATDLQMPQQSHASWTSASPWVVSELNRLVKEPENLAMFDFAVYEFTFNMPGEFSQTQLAVLCEVPAQETVDHYRPIQVLCAPPGTKYIDFEIESKQQLVGLGWVERSVGAAPQHNRSLRRGMKARRQQYGLRPHVSNTFHGAMGATLCKMATEVNVRGSGNQLWEKGQVVVLVSRTKCCKDLIFVGNQETTLEVIAELIQVRSQYDQYIEHVLQVLSNQGNPTTALDQHRVIDDRHHFLRSNDIPLPEAGTGCCYLLVSTKNFHVTYIGQTMRALATRLREHNEGQGSAQTKPQTLRPWGLLAFVAGFDCDRDALKSFEQIWEEKRFELFRHRRGEVTTDEIVSLGTNLMSDEIFESMNLRMVIKGQIIRHQE